MKDGKRVTWSVKLTEEESRLADEICAEAGLTRSEWLGDFVRAMIAGYSPRAAARVTPGPDPLRVPFSSAERQ